MSRLWPHSPKNTERRHWNFSLHGAFQFNQFTQHDPEQWCISKTISIYKKAQSKISKITAYFKFMFNIKNLRVTYLKKNSKTWKSKQYWYHWCKSTQIQKNKFHQCSYSNTVLNIHNSWWRQPLRNSKCWPQLGSMLFL